MEENQNLNHVRNENDRNSTMDLEYYNSKIIKTQELLDSDIESSRALRIIFIVIFGICLLGYFKVIGINKYFNYALTLFSILIIVVSYSKSKQKKFASEIEFLNSQKKKVMELEGQGKSSQYFDSLVGINIRNLEEYYELVKTSNKKSFNVSLIMCFMGVFIVLLGTIYGYFNSGKDKIPYIVSATGIIIEVISGLLFYLYNRTVIQLKDYHTSLLDVQNMLLSFKLIEDLKNEDSKSKVMQTMVENLLRNKQ